MCTICTYGKCWILLPPTQHTIKTKVYQVCFSLKSRIVRPPKAHFVMYSVGQYLYIFQAQACKLKFRLRERALFLLFSAAALAVCFEGHMAGLDKTETGNELSQPKFEFTSLFTGSDKTSASRF